MNLISPLLFSGLVVFVFLADSVPAHAQPVEPESSEWEGVMHEFEAADRENPPPHGAVLFIGSSSIRLWRSLEADFPKLDIINRGFGGSEIKDSVAFADRIVIPYRPSLIVFYAGENDINAGKSPKSVAEDFQTFVSLVRESLPGTKIAFIAMKPSPSRWQLADLKRTGNALIRDFISTAPGVDYINVWDPMLGENGEPRREIFVDDELHLNADGYRLWKSIVAPYLEHHKAMKDEL